MTESYTHFLEDQGYKEIALSFNEMDSATENTIDSMIVVSVIFYDVTTIYFQIDDEVRKRGFSKEGIKTHKLF